MPRLDSCGRSGALLLGVFHLCLPPLSRWAVSAPRCSIADPTDGHLMAPRSRPAGALVQGLRQSQVVAGQAPTWGSGEGPLGTGGPLTLGPSDLGWAQRLSRAQLIRSGPPRVTSLFEDLLIWGLSCNSQVPSRSTEKGVGIPWWSCGQASVFSLPWAQVQSLVREVRSCKSYGVAKN